MAPAALFLSVCSTAFISRLPKKLWDRKFIRWPIRKTVFSGVKRPISATLSKSRCFSQRRPQLFRRRRNGITPPGTKARKFAAKLQGVNFLGDYSCRIKSFLRSERQSVRRINMHGIATFNQRFYKPFMLGRQPPFAGKQQHRLAGSAAFAGHGN